MKIEVRLSLIKQQYTELLSICSPAHVSDLKPIESQRNHYNELLKNLINHIDVTESEFKKGILEDALVQKDIPRDNLLFYKETIIPNLAEINSAFEFIDPSFSDLYQLIRELSVPNILEEKIRFTFEVALERMGELTEENHDLRSSFAVAKANDILDSKLIDFKPDEWLENANELNPIRTSRKGADIPVHVRYRVLEIYRSYIFGNWISVLALSRSVLEYVILDNLHKFNIKPQHLTTINSSKKTTKSLKALIIEVGEKTPDILSSMEKVREYGNEYIHPKTTKISREVLLFRRKENAKDCLYHLRIAIETLYLVSPDKT